MVTAFGDEALKEVIKVKCDHNGGILIQLDRCLSKKKRHQRTLYSQRKGHMRTTARNGCPGKKALAETNPSDI